MTFLSVRSIRAVRCFAVSLALLGATPSRDARAQDAEPAPPPAAPTDEVLDPGRDTNRLTLGVGGGMFASFPLSIEDPGPNLIAGKPLWLGQRYKFFQWELHGLASAGYGTRSHHGYFTAGPQFGFELYLGPVFGFDLRLGPAAMMQVGARTVPALGFGSSGGYVFRFWKDDRKRIKLETVMNVGVVLARDPGNDVGTNAGQLGAALIYEAPL